MVKLRLTSEILPPKGQWVLVTTEDWQKPWEIMCYMGIKTNKHDIGNGWEEYEYPAWTSGHGDIQSKHPYGWMPLPNHLLDKDIQAFNVAISALEQQPCEDAVSREAVIERLKKEDKILYTTTGLNYLIRAIEGLRVYLPSRRNLLSVMMR